MTNLLQGASDDQIALIGCIVALAGSAALMYLSFFVGPASRNQNGNVETDNAIRQMPIRPAVDSTHDRAA